MESVRPKDARSFLRLAAPLLQTDETRNNLILGIARSIAARPDLYPRHRFWTVAVGDGPVAAGLRTEPDNLVLADPAIDAALEPLLHAVAEDDPKIPGLIANAPFADRAAEIWTRLAGATVTTRFAEGVHELTSVAAVPSPRGRARSAEPNDRELAIAWAYAFAIEAIRHRTMDREQVRRLIDGRLEREDAGLWLWEVDGAPVSMAGYSATSSLGARIGDVYTPPEHRRRGFATALVAELSAWLLANGRRTCFLYTDLSNPTSNAIYATIGYHKVADAFEILFSTR